MEIHLKGMFLCTIENIPSKLIAIRPCPRSKLYTTLCNVFEDWIDGRYVDRYHSTIYNLKQQVQSFREPMKCITHNSAALHHMYLVLHFLYNMATFSINLIYYLKVELILAILRIK